MKKKIYIIFIMTLSLFFGCNKQLDVQPYASISDDTAKKQLDNLVVGMYAYIGSGNSFQNGVYLNDNGGLYGTDLILNADLLASENYVHWLGTFTTYRDIAIKQIGADNSIVFRMWRKAYKAINLANVILENSVVTDSAYRAEALFVRGIMYFELVRFWGEYGTGLGVPILLKATNTYEQIQQPSRATIAEVYSQVIADLTAAKSLFAVSSGGIYGNEATVSAFLARVYLMQGDYQNALDQANSVVGSTNNYSLVASVADAFNGVSSNESIFQIEQTTLNNAGSANDGLTTFYGCDPDNIAASAGRGDITIDSLFYSKYDSTDERFSKLIYKGNCSKGTVTSYKWHDPYANIPVIRLAEMFLIRAECNVRLGSAVGDTPLNDINKIRTRSGASELASVDLDAVLLERELELAFEGQRIHDLRRNNIGDYRAGKYVFPIPQSEINTNPNLEQNSYYKK